MDTPEPTVSDSPAVVVSVVDDDIRIEPGRAQSAAGLRSALDVAGGLLTFDVAKLDAPPSITITDLAVATSWLDDVFGTGASAIALQVADDGETRVFGFAQTVSASALARLAFGAWMLRWWPIDDEVAEIDFDLLRVELAALAWEQADVFLDRQPAGALLDGDVIGGLTRAISRPAGVAIATAAAHAALELWGPDHESIREVEEFVELLSARSASDEIDAAPFTGLSRAVGPVSRVPANISDLALAADLDEPESSLERGARDRRSVDWIQVPARTLDWSEHTIALRLERRTLRVAVRAVGRHSASLFARVYDMSDADESLPMALMPLTLLNDEYRGGIELDRDIEIHDIAVDVYAAETVRAPRLSDDERKSAIETREKVRSRIKARSRARARHVGDAPAPGPDAPFFAELP